MDDDRWPVRPAAVALDLLAPGEAAVADALLRDDPEFRAEVEALRRAGTALETAAADDWERPDPPPLDLAAALAVRPAAPATPPERRPRRRILAAAAAMALLLLAVGFAGGRLTGGEPAVDGRAIALAAAPGSTDVGASAVLSMSARDGELVVRGLPASRRGEFYELWLLGSDRRAVSVTTFRVGSDGRADVRFSMGADPAAYRLLDVSRERDDGDPTHSGASVLRSRTLS